MGIVPWWANKTHVISGRANRSRPIYALLGSIILVLFSLLVWALLRKPLTPTVINNYTVINPPAPIGMPAPHFTPTSPLTPPSQVTPPAQATPPGQAKPVLHPVPGGSLKPAVQSRPTVQPDPASGGPKPAAPKITLAPVPIKPTANPRAQPNRTPTTPPTKNKPVIQKAHPIHLLVEPTPPPPPNLPDVTRGKPELEMVFVVDTTGSMGGLLEGAKQRIWNIVNQVQKSSAHPIVRIGLVAYRDHGDDYITKVLPLTSDLDTVYTTLMAFQASGGGDIPEDVRQALADGVHKVGWSSDTSHVAQVLFLVGDAPPHDDYTEEPDTATTTDEAMRAGIFVNTIQCGNASDTRDSWQAISSRGHGEYFAIPQDGGVQLIDTPYDKPLAELASRLGSTYMAYGGGTGSAGIAYRFRISRRQAETEINISSGAPLGAQADRALNKALNGFAYNGDLLTGIENGTLRWETVNRSELPDSVQRLAPEAQRQEIQQRLAERKNLRSRILALSNQRDAYLADQTKKTTGSKEESFDTAVAAALRKEAAQKGISW